MRPPRGSAKPRRSIGRIRRNVTPLCHSDRSASGVEESTTLGNKPAQDRTCCLGRFLDSLRSLGMTCRLNTGLYLVGGSAAVIDGKSIATDPFLVSLPSLDGAGSGPPGLQRGLLAGGGNLCSPKQFPSCQAAPYRSALVAGAHSGPWGPGFAGHWVGPSKEAAP